MATSEEAFDSAELVANLREALLHDIFPDLTGTANKVKLRKILDAVTQAEDRLVEYGELLAIKEETGEYE